VFKDTKAFSSFSVDDVPAAKRFYTETLGVNVTDEMGGLGLHLGGGHEVFVYPKDDHEPAAHTVLNFAVDDVDDAVARLTDAGVTLERYDGFEQDEKGVMRGEGPAIAWFKDPAGNTLSVLEEPS
jgi:catechol 2,3-dioxygenase-like lactoylglutathione lyase family enzyme